MSTATRNGREDAAVIVIDSDDETPSTKPLDVGPSSRQPASGLRQKAHTAGTKRSRNGDAQSSRRRSLSQHAPADTCTIDLTCGAPTMAENRQHCEEVCIVGAEPSSPAAKRRNIAVAKMLEAHRNAGKQIAASKHKILPVDESQEKESKPKCGICLDEMKEPACGSCGHVFCKPCLLSCLKATKKCPTCRKTLQPRTVHRIYLS
ncbi:hypothetical protein ABBQ38_015452 [Trebouxia sp. C0009 RCD-2024]